VSLEQQSIATDTPAASPTDDQTIIAVAADSTTTEGETKPEAEDKPAKTAQELRIEELERNEKRMQRGIDRRTRQLSDARAQLDLTRSAPRPHNQPTQDDSEPLSLTRAQIAEMVNAEAVKLAPTLRQEAAETERRQSVIQSLAKTWGQERFDEVSSELDDVFGGLTDRRSGLPKPAIEAIFEADEPAKVLEWLTDPDNLDEAERISGLSAVQAGKAIAKLEAKLATKTPKPNPQVSKAPAPLEAVRGQGGASNNSPNPSDTKAWIRWSNEQERKGQ
jgi:hypothetical protein